METLKLESIISKYVLQTLGAKKINKTFLILYNSQYIERSYNITMNKYKVEEILIKH